MAGLFAAILLAPVLAFSHLLRLAGLRALGALGNGAGALLHALGFRGKVVSGNLELALGRELSPAQLATLRSGIYANIGLTFLEIARNFSISRQQMLQELELAESDRRTIQEIMGRGKGIVFISGHVANWELLGMGMAAHGLPVAVVAKKMSSPLSQRLLERQRERTGLEIIYSGGAIEKMKRVLAQGKVIGFMIDQNTTGKKGIRANFFGVPASSIRGLAGLVRDTGTAVVPICSFRQPGGRHKVVILPELPYLQAEPSVTDPEERKLREEWLNTQAYQAAVEALIRRHPEQWLWIHRRWKTSREPLTFETAHLENQPTN